MKIIANSGLFQDLPPGVQTSLSNNLKRIVEGSSEILVSPILDEIDDSDIETFIRETLDDHKDFIPKTLLQLEESNLSKFGPRSIAKPWEERRSSLSDYFESESDDTYIDYFDRVSEGNGILRAAETSSVLKKLVKQSSTGLPYMTRKGLLTGRQLDEAEKDYGVWPCVLFTRTQEQGKTRNVWGYPVSDTIMEQKFLIPYLRYEKLLPWRSALNGPEAVDDAMHKLLSRFNNDDNNIAVCVDFSNFDASVQPWHSAVAFGEIASRFQEKEREFIRILAQRFISIPIVTPGGTYHGFHGVPSGSSFTNTIDSSVQLLCSGDFLDDGGNLQVQGDDGVYLTRGSDQAEALIQSFKYNGLQLNEDKTFHGRREDDGFLEAIYLQRYFSARRPGGIYPISRALNRIKYLERWTDFARYGIEGSDFFALRTIMILENCKHHPCFGDLVRYVQKADKHGLRFNSSAIPAFSSVDEAKSRAGVTHEASIRGIGMFDTVKLLRGQHTDYSYA